MKCLELVKDLPHLSSRLAVRKIGVKLEFSLVTHDVPKDAAIVGNFKPRLVTPDEEFWIAIPRSDGKFEQVPITAGACCEAFLREIVRLLRANGRKFGKDTVLRFSEPPFASATERKTYRTTIQKAAKEAGLGTVSFFREPDAVFEYFRLLQRKVPAQGKSLNFLVLDFGGGTCNVSVVSTKRTGEVWQRYIAAPVAAEAHAAGGLYIDQELLTQALRDANLQHLYGTGSSREHREAYMAWLSRHMPAAEHLKRVVSETGRAHRMTVPLDGKLGQLANGLREMELSLDPARLRSIVEKHWTDRKIQEAVQRTLLQLHQRLTKTAQRADVGSDPRSLITHVIIAGGSSRLPGFIDHVKKYFEPFTPEPIPVGPDYPYAVAVGMGLNHLSMERALLDERAPLVSPPTKGGKATPESPGHRATDSTFLKAFEDDVGISWLGQSDIPIQTLIPDSTSPLELLEAPNKTRLKIPPAPSSPIPSKAVERRVGYQLVYVNDPEATSGLSSRRLNLLENQLAVPGGSEKFAEFETYIQETPQHALELVLQVRDETRRRKVCERRFSLLGKEPAIPSATTPEVTDSTKTATAKPLGKLLAEGADVLCIDFGTTNTTVVDLSVASELSIEQFCKPARAVPLITVRVEPLPDAAPPQAPAVPSAAPATPARPPKAPALPLAAAQATVSEIRTAAVPPPPPPTPPSSAVAAENLKVAAVPVQHRDELSALREAVLPASRPRQGKPFSGTEKEYIQHLNDTCRASKFEFPLELLESLYLSQKVRPFVVLAGPSGVGKSALARFMAEASGASPQNGEMLRVAVEAHWTDSRSLLGRREGDEFRGTDLYKLLRRTEDAPNRLYHVLLDEMNLAHVEYYFAQVLSSMESDGVLYVPDERPGNTLRLPMVGNLPLLRFYGTINVDESTQMLSDKVLDRVNVIEVEALPPKERIATEARRIAPEPQIHLSLETLRQWHRVPEEVEVPLEIREIWSVMARRASNTPQGPEQTRLPISIGLRIIREISLFVHYAEKLDGAIKRRDAIDLQVKQRILPKIRGDIRLKAMFGELLPLLEKHQLTRSFNRLASINSQFAFDEFVTFWA